MLSFQDSAIALQAPHASLTSEEATKEQGSLSELARGTTISFPRYGAPYYNPASTSKYRVLSERRNDQTRIRFEVKDKRKRKSQDLSKVESSRSLSVLKLAEADLTLFCIHAYHPYYCKQRPDCSSSQISDDLLISGAKMSLSGYIFSRFPSILPTLDPAPNPFKLLATVNRKQWMFFLVSFTSNFPLS
jgi:hypothetical protein